MAIKKYMLHSEDDGMGREVSVLCGGCLKDVLKHAPLQSDEYVTPADEECDCEGCMCDAEVA